MMIWAALGVGADAWDVSVLCGAGGASTVQADEDSTVSDTDSSAMALSLRGRLSTFLSVSTGRGIARSCFLRLGPRAGAASGGGVQFGLAHPHDLRRDLDTFVLGTELHGLLQAELKRSSQSLHHIGR